jgi:hypothetical protein
MAVDPLHTPGKQFTRALGDFALAMVTSPSAPTIAADGMASGASTQPS